jgi:hypothetical protein
VDRARELTEIVLASPWHCAVLDTVDALVLPDWWIGAGVVRDFVWDERFGHGFAPGNVDDVDVVFFDSADLAHERETRAEDNLRATRPELTWDVTNQARVHLWYEDRFGIAAPPLTSTIDGIATWPETATAVAVRRRRGGQLEIAAPLGLDDLLDGIWRRNDRLVTDAEYNARLARKQPRTRWPGVRVIT